MSLLQLQPEMGPQLFSQAGAAHPTGKPPNVGVACPLSTWGSSPSITFQEPVYQLFTGLPGSLAAVCPWDTAEKVFGKEYFVLYSYYKLINLLTTDL